MNDIARSYLGGVTTGYSVSEIGFAHNAPVHAGHPATATYDELPMSSSGWAFNAYAGFEQGPHQLTFGVRFFRLHGHSDYTIAASENTNYTIVDVHAFAQYAYLLRDPEYNFVGGFFATAGIGGYRLYSENFGVNTSGVSLNLGVGAIFGYSLVPGTVDLVGRLTLAGAHLLIPADGSTTPSFTHFYDFVPEVGITFYLP